jgi:hypothetical protein
VRREVEEWLQHLRQAMAEAGRLGKVAAIEDQEEAHRRIFEASTPAEREEAHRRLDWLRGLRDEP